MDIIEKIRNGEYKNKATYPAPPRLECSKCTHKIDSDDNFCSECGAKNDYQEREKAWKKKTAAYNKKEAKLYKQFCDDALTDLGIKDHPAADRAMYYAYQKGHARGLEEIYIYLSDISYVLVGE